MLTLLETRLPVKGAEASGNNFTVKIQIPNLAWVSGDNFRVNAFSKGIMPIYHMTLNVQHRKLGQQHHIRDNENLDE